MYKNMFLLVGVALWAVGCSNNNSSTADVFGNGTVELSLSGIEPMAGQHLEGWLIAKSGPISTGRFVVEPNLDITSVDVNGNAISVIGNNGKASFSYAENGESISKFVLTIEPDGDSDPAPSEVHYVAGNFNSGSRSAVATTQDGAAIGVSFLNDSGTYILATPTNGPATHNQGIWFLAGGEASLNIDDLTDTGWAYEGWIVGPSGPISTGIFFSREGADLDGAGPDAGAMAAPPFPGQDYIAPTARILNNGTYTTVITVEPYPDFDPAPFTLKILRDPIDNGEAVTTPIGLENFSNEASIEVTATLP